VGQFLPAGKNSVQGMTAEKLIDFFESRGKFILSDNYFFTDAGNLFP